MCLRALRRKFHLRKIKRMHVRNIVVRTNEELYNKRKEVFSDLNRAVRDEQRSDGVYLSGMRDMLKWVLCEE